MRGKNAHFGQQGGSEQPRWSTIFKPYANRHSLTKRRATEFILSIASR